MDSLSYLASTQNQDGGWGFDGGTSWTEASALALMPLRFDDAYAGSYHRGCAWLVGAQRDDGGWAPHPAVKESTWVTALAVCVLSGGGNQEAVDRGVSWLLHNRGMESKLLQTLRRRLRGQRLETGEGTTGWSWFPDTSGWAIPTAISIVALQRTMRRRPVDSVRERIEMGRRFLLERPCLDGGWNYGAPRALGVETNSYAETTGVALLALRGARTPVVDKALIRAEEHLRASHSAQAAAWLRLGMLAHGRTPPPVSVPKCRNVLDHAVTALATLAQNGADVFGINHVDAT